MTRVAFPVDTVPGRPPNDWQADLAEAVTGPAELCRSLALDPALAVAAEQAAAEYPLRVPRAYVRRMRPGDPADPLLRQVLPQREELADAPGYSADPLGEAAAAGCPGLLAKYQGRSLILATPACAVHCRFCFRRHFLRKGEGGRGKAEGGRGKGEGGGDAELEPALRRIAIAPDVHEVVLSGGDPLTLPDEQLADLAERVAAIVHVRRLRVHTRMPIVVPRRVTGELLCWLRGTRLSTVVVVHINHPAELDAAVAAALGRLVDAGVPVLSQGVLLRGVNDSVEVMAELYERLVDLRVMPYYLHQLDPVAGAAHFEVPIGRGVELMKALRRRLPGYAVPRYVREPPRGESKEVLA